MRTARPQGTLADEDFAQRNPRVSLEIEKAGVILFANRLRLQR